MHPSRVRQAGLEPATSDLASRCSGHLSYYHMGPVLQYLREPTRSKGLLPARHDFAQASLILS